MVIEVEVLNPARNESKAEVEIDVKNARRLSAGYIRQLVWKKLEEEHGHRANPDFEVPEAEALAKRLIALPAAEEKRFDVCKHYSKQWWAYYKRGFGSPAVVNGADEAAAKLEALALFRKSREFVDERRLEDVVDRIEPISKK